MRFYWPCPYTANCQEMKWRINEAKKETFDPSTQSCNGRTHVTFYTQTRTPTDINKKSKVPERG